LNQILLVTHPPVLEVNNLTVCFPTENGISTVVNDISFTLAPSETLAIVGESGSGKTVTALTILRLLPEPPARVSANTIAFRSHDSGLVDILSLDIKKLQQLRGRHISMIFQEPMSSLNPVFTCGDQVSESLRKHMGWSGKMARERVLDLFNEVRLPRPHEIYSSYPHQLSGGQKQRVMIAMAISCDPAVLIADEPTTALDVTVQRTIIELLSHLQANRKMGVLFITHDLALVSGFAHRVLVMNAGKMVEQGHVDRIFNNPVQSYTRGLMACRPSIDKRYYRLPTVGDFLMGKPPETIPEIPENERADEHRRIYRNLPVLRVENLEKRYGPHRVLENANFEVYKGETLGIVGESGCGKTTLARTALNLIQPTAGKVIYKNTQISGFGGLNIRTFRKDLQIIFQDPYSSLNPRITAGLAITEPMKMHGIGDDHKSRVKKAMDLMLKVGLDPNHFYRYPHEFSGGQRQRICIARALALQPELVICDESVSALDVSVQAQVLNLLNDLKKEFNLTYIFISHDLAVVKYMSDRIMVMQNGRIVEMGEADQLFKNPATSYTKMLLNAIPGNITN